jgi:mannitol/fructose-specific phosphotransferase system IIA component (Ntr-type)
MMTEEDQGLQSPPAEKVETGSFPSLLELLPPERIRLAVEVSSWQEAVRAAGQLLFESGAVTNDYIEAMIKVAEELGPYIAIAPGIALPHAASEAGARKTALSLVKLSVPINFGNPDNDPVRLVFGMSAIDKKVHIFALQTLAELFLSKDLMDQLFAAETVDAVIGLFKRAQAILRG